MKRRLLDPYLFGPLGLDTAHPWWQTGGLPDFPGLHTQPAGAGEGGAAGGGTGSDGEPNAGTGAGGAGEGGTSTSEESGDVLRMKEHLSAADRKRAEAEKERDELAQRLKAIEDKDKSELDKTTERVKELETAITQRDADIAELRLHNAFLTVNSVKWHDPKAALLLAQREGYLDDVVDEKGKVDEVKLKSKLEKLGKDKAYLVDKQDGAQPPAPSGTPTGSGGRGNNSGSADDAAIKSRYRSLTR
jgi:hypothetical protein